MDSSLTSIKNWFNSLTRQQAGIVGGIGGYMFGMFSAPFIKILLALTVLILFGLIGRHIENKFESRLGFIGIIAAILVCTTMGPIQHAIGSALAGIIAGTSRFALAIVGGYLLLQVHDSLKPESK